MRVKLIEQQFSAVLSERNRLAREIHDTLAQGLAGISLQLELVARMLSIKPEAAKAPLDQARQLVRSSLDEARRSVWDLRSQALENNDLPAAVNESAKELTAGSSTQIQSQSWWHISSAQPPDRRQFIAHHARSNHECDQARTG